MASMIERKHYRLIAAVQRLVAAAKELVAAEADLRRPAAGPGRRQAKEPSAKSELKTRTPDGDRQGPTCAASPTHPDLEIH
jgi:hypothetical protein